MIEFVSNPDKINITRIIDWSYDRQIVSIKPEQYLATFTPNYTNQAAAESNRSYNRNINNIINPNHHMNNHYGNQNYQYRNPNQSNRTSAAEQNSLNMPNNSQRRRR